VKVYEMEVRGGMKGMGKEVSNEDVLA